MHKPPKNVDLIPFADERHWLAARSKDVTASVAGALFGVHEFITPYDLWADKSGRIAREDLSGNIAIQRGKLLEPVAVELMRQEHPEWDIHHNTGAKTVYYRASNQRIGATPDTLVECPDRGPGTVQIKSVEQSIFRRKWTPDGIAPEPPLWIAMQVIIEAHLTGSKWAAVAPLVVGHGITLPIIDIPLVADVMDAVIAKTADFWDGIESGVEPVPDFSLDGDTIDGLHPTDQGGEIDLVSDRSVYALIEQRSDLLDQRQTAIDKITEIDNRLKHAMQGCGLAYLPNGMRMTWRNQRRVAADGTVNVFRVLRVPRPADQVLDAPSAPKPQPTTKINDTRWQF